MTTELDTEVRTLLAERRGNWLAIAEGAQVSHSWISKFVNGHIPNPGYEKLKRLHGYLSPKRRRSPKEPSPV